MPFGSIMQVLFFSIIFKIRAEVPTPVMCYFPGELSYENRVKQRSHYGGYCNISDLLLSDCLGKHPVNSSTYIMKIIYGNITLTNSLHKYINLTVQFKEDSVLSSVRLYDESFKRCWKLEIVKSEAVIVRYLPVYSVSTSFKLIEANKECYLLHRSTLLFQQTSKNTINLELLTEKTIDFNYRLYYGLCNINCSGRKGDCDMHKQTEGKIHNLGRQVLKNENNKRQYYFQGRQVFRNLTPAFYCVNIGPEECPIYTETVPICNDSDTTQEHPMQIKQYMPGLMEEIILSGGLILVLILITCTVIAHFILAESDGVNQVQVYIRRRDFEVFLVYTNESHAFLDIAYLFRKILSPYFKKVWDLYDEDEINNVIENKEVWVLNLFKKENLKVVLVETEDSVIREEAWVRNAVQPATERLAFLNDLFPYILTMLTSMTFLKDISNKLYVVRFYKSLNGIKFQHFKKCQKYVMPEDFHSLVKDISELKKPRDIHDLIEHERASPKHLEIFSNKLLEYNTQKQFYC